VYGRESHVRAVIALDRSSGATLWIYDDLEAPISPMHKYNSPATPTPVVTRDGVYAWFGSAGLVALDIQGRLRWKRMDLPFAGPHGGPGSSLAAEDNIVVLTGGGPEHPYLAALDGRSGSVLWRHNLAASSVITANSRTPLIVRWEGRPVVLHWGVQDVSGIEVRSGAPCFVFSLPKGLQFGAATSTPAVHGGNLYLAATNGALRLRIDDLGDYKADPVVWVSRGSGADYSSPLIVGQSLFLVDEDGNVSVRNIESGEVVHEQVLEGTGFYSSPVGDGDRLLVCSSDGLCSVISAIPPIGVVRTFQIGTGVFASPAVHEGILYVRSAGAVEALSESRSY
jgi:outer membrane protein assembly factor BamB